MATYDNSYAMKITPNTPTLRGLTTNYSNNGQTNLGGIGLGDLFELDYDRDKIENIFNQGTDAQYALMQKENQIAQNQYANNQFQQQQMALDTLRTQRNSQIASGMARGLNAAADQAQVLGLQQEGMSGALELANEQQTMADTIAAEYANNVVEALKEANSVKQAMAEVSAMLYDADMLGYTGELSAAAQMDKNASDRYGYDVGLEGTKYAADKEYAATIGAANIQAAATKAAAAMSAGTGNSAEDTKSLLEQGIEKAVAEGKTGNALVNAVRDYLVAENSEYAERDAAGTLWDQIDSYIVTYHSQYKDQTKKDWEKSQTNNSMVTNAGGNAAGGGSAGGRTIKTVPAYLKNHPDLQLAYGYTKANGYVDATY